MRKSIVALTIASLVMLQFAAFYVPSVAASVERILKPIADAWVDVGLNTGANHGSDTELWVGRGTLAIDRAYLKFDLSTIPSGATIVEAELILYMSSTDYPSDARELGVYYCANDTWFEGTIMGSNAPAFSSDPTDTVIVDDVWTYYWTVTSDVSSALWKNKISFVVKWVTETGMFGDDYTKKFNSKEAGTNVPVLSIRYSVDGDSVDAVAGSTPNIDGAIGGIEWSTASYFKYAVADYFEVICYVMQDGEKLYIALNIDDNRPWGTDGPILYFDTNNDNATPPQQDDIKYIIYRNGIISREVGNGTDWVQESSTDWSAARTTSSNGWQVEFSFDYSELSITAGVEKTLGFHVWTWDVDEFGDWAGSGTWPYEGDVSGDIVSVPPHWIPELSTWTSMILILMVLAVAITIYKRRLPKNTNSIK